MRLFFVFACMLAMNLGFAATETDDVVFERLKSPASVCVMGDPCSENIGKVSAVNAVTETGDGTHIIKMLNSGPSGTMVFEPANLKISPGESVTFVPTDGGHNSASIPGLIPEGVEPWEGGMSKELKITFEKEGVYVYQCTPHVMMAMVGVITVGSPTNLEQIINKSKDLRKGFMMNKDRLRGYLSEIK